MYRLGSAYYTHIGYKTPTYNTVREVYGVNYDLYCKIGVKRRFRIEIYEKRPNKNH